MDRRLRLPLFAAVALILVGAVLVAVGKWVHRPTPDRIDRAVRQWATDRALALSDSVYHLSLGPLRFDTAGSGVGIDSIRIETDSARNARRPRPLPIVSLVLRDGDVDGLDVQALIKHRSPTIEISAIRFERIEAKVRLPPTREDSAGILACVAPRSSELASRRIQGSGPGSRSPAWGHTRSSRGADRAAIDQYRRPSRARPAGPGPERAPIGARPWRRSGGDRRQREDPVYARDIRLVAERYRGVWSRLASAAAARVEASVGDSLLRIGGLEVRPTLRGAELRRHLRWRHTRVVLRVADVEARGVDYASMLGRVGVVVGTIDLTEPRLDLLLDRNLEADPRPQPARMPQ